jgi:hypothetical protein
VRPLFRSACIQPLALLSSFAFGLFASKATVAAPTAEFDIPYQLRVSDDGAVLELSGSFSLALPQSLQAVLASAPAVRTVRLESPGGHIQPAIQVAEIIHNRGLDTYVGRFCASACTIAFLGGRQRWIGPSAHLAFHQASAPGLPSDLPNGYLRAAYESFHTPPAFVARVLSTPASDLWYPTTAELRAAHYTTSEPPGSIIAHDSGWPPRLSDFAQSVRQAPDQAVVRFSVELSNFLAQLQEIDPEACWAFAHEGPDTSAATLPKAVNDAIASAGKALADAARNGRGPSWNPAIAKSSVTQLVATIRENGMAPAMQGLRHGAEHATFCPSFHGLLQTVLALPPSRRVDTLRAMLSGGGHTTGHQ